MEKLQSVPLRPVFVMGLHRSGTTFLYDCIAKSFPVAHLDLYRLFFYPRLLANQRDGLEARDRQSLNDMLAGLGIQDRGIDGVEINDGSVEEYGFLLRRLGDSFKISDHNAEQFAQMCRKLLALQPGCQAVLLKNPWDTGNALRILAHFPEARFIYIQRETLDVLNSMLNALLAYLSGPQHYLELLLRTDSSRRGYRLGYAAWWLMRGLRRLLGERRIALMCRRILAKNVVAQQKQLLDDCAALPADRAMMVEYNKLVTQPEAVIKQLETLLQLPCRGLSAQAMPVRRRRNLNPVLVGYQSELDKITFSHMMD